jgi:hypothetical protein
MNAVTSLEREFLLNFIHITQHVHTCLVQPGDGKSKHFYPAEIEHGV